MDKLRRIFNLKAFYLCIGLYLISLFVLSSLFVIPNPIPYDTTKNVFGNILFYTIPGSAVFTMFSLLFLTQVYIIFLYVVSLFLCKVRRFKSHITGICFVSSMWLNLFISDIIVSYILTGEMVGFYFLRQILIDRVTTLDTLPLILNIISVILSSMLTGVGLGLNNYWKPKNIAIRTVTLTAIYYTLNLL